MIAVNANEFSSLSQAGMNTTRSFDPESRPVPYMAGTESSPLEPMVVEALNRVYDPEIPVSVYELGLIYDIRISDAGQVRIVMTLTTPMCPVAEELPRMIERAVHAIGGVTGVEVELVWEPFWKPEFMSPETRLQLGLL